MMYVPILLSAGIMETLFHAEVLLGFMSWPGKKLLQVVILT
jgi:hypothetical protein